MIASTIERAFKQTCQELLKEDLDKNFKVLSCLSDDEAKTLLKKTRTKIEKKLQNTDLFLEQIKKELEILATLLPRDYEFDKLDFNALKKSKERLIRLDKQFNSQELILQIILLIKFQNDCELIRLECIVCKNEREEKELLITWLGTMADFFIKAGEYLYTQNESLALELKKWEID